MTNRSHLRSRGWMFVVVAAGLLTGLLWGALFLSKDRGLEYYESNRMTHLVASSTKAPPNIATENIRLEAPDANLEPQRSDWSSYRTRINSTSIAALEPVANIRMVAPRIDTEADWAIHSLLSSIASKEFLPTNTTNNKTVSQTKTSDQLRTTKEEYYEALGRRIQMDSMQPATSNGWPIASGLRSSLHSLQSVNVDPRKVDGDTTSIGLTPTSNLSREAKWSEEVLRELNQLSSLPSISDSRAATILDSLQRLALENQTAIQAEPLPNPTDVKSLRIAHGLIRRIAVWKAVWQATHRSATSISMTSPTSVDVSLIRERMDSVMRDSIATGDVAGWKQYLLIQDLYSIISGDEQDLEYATYVARTILSRIAWPQASEVQREFLDSKSVRQFAEAIQPLAVRPIDYRSLLADIESIEDHPEHRARLSVASAMQSLKYSNDADQNAIGDAIEVYYRNANLRVAVSANFINRLLPKNKTMDRPVRQNILGAETRGNSQIDTTLEVRLIPDAKAWKLDLDLTGRVKSSTRSSRGPAVFYNASKAAINTTRTLRITTEGIQVQSGEAAVQSEDALRGMDTDFDGLPIVGDVVRYYAEKSFQEKRGPARRIMQRSIAKQTDAEFDRQLDQQIDKAESAFDQRLLGPLRRLNLNPLVTDLSTTQDRLIARYRLAANNSLAACTPRPQAPSDAQLSMQMHQSAMNNAFSQLGLSSKDWTLVDLAQNIAKQLGQDGSAIANEDAPEDVIIRFAGDRPISIEFSEGRMWLTLRVAKLSQPGRIELSDFIIRTSYLPAVTGMDAQLVREGAISVDGERLSMRERLPLRAIFAKVFAARSTIPLVSEQLLSDPRAKGLGISQILMEEGWLAIAISEESSPHVAQLRENQSR